MSLPASLKRAPQFRKDDVSSSQPIGHNSKDYEKACNLGISCVLFLQFNINYIDEILQSNRDFGNPSLL